MKNFANAIRFGLIVAALFAMPCLSKAQSIDRPVFNHAALCAANLKKTADFYRNVIELKEIKNPFHDTTHVWLKIGEGLALHIIQGDCGGVTQKIGVHICFSVPSLQAFIAHLEQLKITYSDWAGEPKKIQVRADGVKQIYLQDPDGYWVEINDAKE